MKLNDVKSKYTSAGDIIYRIALQLVLAKGTEEAKRSKPEILNTIDSYILGCAAEIAESDDFVDSIIHLQEEDSLWDGMNDFGEDIMTDGITECVLDTLRSEYRADEDTKLLVDIKTEESK